MTTVATTTDVMKKVLSQEEEARLVWEANTFECGFSIAELRALFELVENKNDWKARINTSILVDEVEFDYHVNGIRTAIYYFTSTPSTITWCTLSTGKIQLTVKALGYRAGPAGDH